MIKTIAEMLLAFMDEESKKLDEYELKHAPTIGDMYEGLSAQIINKTVPEQLGLQVSNGFVHDGLGNLSGQIDCMLVRGEGEPIPYTNSFKWHVKDIIAVFEVKKNLYSQELVDSFCHLRKVAESFSSWVLDGPPENGFDISSALRVFSKVTGIYAPEFKDKESLPPPLQLIYHTLIIEQLSPIRIVLGYGGYKSEKTLREGLVTFLEKQGAGQGFGVPSFPHLITCNGISLAKLNGQPFFRPMVGDYWDFYGSTTSNPLVLILELIWTKISRELNVNMPWGDDLEVELMNKFMSAQPIIKGGSGGWMLNYTEMSNKTLNENPKTADWEPIEISLQEFIVFNLLCKENCVDIDSPLFLDIVKDSKLDKTDFIKKITSTTYAALDGNNLSLTTDKCVCAILPNGKFVIAENEDGKLFKYIDKTKEKA